MHARPDPWWRDTERLTAAIHLIAAIEAAGTDGVELHPETDDERRMLYALQRAGIVHSSHPTKAHPSISRITVLGRAWLDQRDTPPLLGEDDEHDWQDYWS